MTKQHTRTTRTIRALADVAQIRHGTLEGQPRLIVPVIALIGDSVVRPMGSSGPEYIPADVIRLGVEQWAGRPVVATHPTNDDGSPSIANTPSAGPSPTFGTTYNPRFRNNRLHLDVYLDPSKARQLGGAAEWAVDEVQAGHMVQVSIGASVVVDPTPGTSPSGEAYTSKWLVMFSDHLAFGLDGAEGACSIADGCGGLRAAQLRAAALDHTLREENPTVSLLQSAKQRLAALVGRTLTDDGVSDFDLRDALRSKLRATVPGFGYVELVYPDTSTVIYSTTTDDEELYFRRSYELDSDGEVVLGDDEQRVQPHQPAITFEPMSDGSDGSDSPTTQQRTSASPPPAKCACSDPGDCQCTDKETTQMSKSTEQLVAALIAHEFTTFDDSSRKALELLSDEQLEEMTATADAKEAEAKAEEEAASAAANEPATPATPATPPPPATPEPTQAPAQLQATPPQPPPGYALIPEAELADIRAASNAHKAQLAAQKSQLVAALTSLQSVYSQAELQAMSVDQLNKVHQLANPDGSADAAVTPLADFSGRPRAVPPSDAASDYDYLINPPDGYGIAQLQQRSDPNRNAN